MIFLKRMLRNILLTFGSMLLLFLLLTIYWFIKISIGMESMPVDNIFVAVGLAAGMAFLFTIGIFFMVLYFPYQVLVLTFNKFTVFFLFFLPALGTVIALITVLCYIASPSTYNTFSTLHEFLWLSIIGFIFVVINNLFVLKTKFR